MNTSFLRLKKTVGDNASDPRAWLAFVLEAAGATRWELPLPGDACSLTTLWQRMTGDESVSAIPRGDLVRLREPLAALLAGDRIEIAFEFAHSGHDGLAGRRRSVIRLVGADPTTARPRRLRGLNFRLPNPATDMPATSLVARQAQALREFEAYTHAVAREMRGPTRAITGLADILLEAHGGAIPEDARRLATRVALAARDLEATLAGLSALTRLSGHELAPGPVDIADLAREAWLELAPGDAAHASRLVLECHGAPLLTADRALVRELLRQLLGNACKFSRGRPQSPVTFSWSPGPPAHYFVRDEGAGFDPATARGLFEPFGRQHPSAQFEGAGIGLALVRRIAERHGGRAWAEARPGEGACLHFTLAPS